MFDGLQQSIEFLCNAWNEHYIYGHSNATIKLWTLLSIGFGIEWTASMAAAYTHYYFLVDFSGITIIVAVVAAVDTSAIAWWFTQAHTFITTIAFHNFLSLTLPSSAYNRLIVRSQCDIIGSNKKILECFQHKCTHVHRTITQTWMFCTAQQKKLIAPRFYHTHLYNSCVE